MFSMLKKKPKNTENVLSQSRRVWKEDLSSFEKIIACFLFGQILNLLYDLLGIREKVKFYNPLFKDMENQTNQTSHIFFVVDAHSKQIKGKEILFKFKNDIKQID